MRPGCTTHWLLVREVRAWGTVTNSKARAYASWLGALWRRHEGARGGRLLHGCGVSGVGRSPSPNRPSFGACGRGPLPTGCECRGCGRGDPSPNPKRALLRAGFARSEGGSRAAGGGGSLPGCGASGVGRSPTPDHASFRALDGARYPLAVGAGGAGVGTHHQPHSARSCELALHAVGAARGHPGGALLAWLWGVRGRALSLRRPPVLWGVRPGPTTHWLRVRGLRALEPVTNSTAALLRAGFARCGGGSRAPRGGASCLAVGRPGSGALPPSTARPLGRAARAHYPLAAGAGVAGVGTGHQLHSGALASWLCALWGRLEGTRQGRLLPGCGAPGVERSPTPDRPSFGACSRGPLPNGCGCGGCGRGDPSPTPARALLQAGFARCGGGSRAPGGGASCLPVKRPGSSALPPPTACPLERAAGACYQLAVGAGVAGVGTGHQLHSARSRELALRAVGAA